MSSEEKRPKVGLGVFVIKDGKILCGKRIGKHAYGLWSFPGGHLEFGESWEECAKRETREETGIEITNVRFATATNDFFDGGEKHYVTIFMIADYDSGEPSLTEPDKWETWDWFDWNDMPKPIIPGTQTLLDQGFDPFSVK